MASKRLNNLIHRPTDGKRELQAQDWTPKAYQRTLFTAFCQKGRDYCWISKNRAANLSLKPYTLCRRACRPTCLFCNMFRLITDQASYVSFIRARHLADLLFPMVKNDKPAPRRSRLSLEIARSLLAMW